MTSRWVTKIRMDEMLMDQVSVKWDFTRLCERGKIRASDNPRIARRSCQILDCGCAMKMKSPSEVRAHETRRFVADQESNE